MNQFERIKFIVFPAVFGTGWGLFEAVAGSYFHAVSFPFKGALMAGCGSIFMCVLRFYVRRKYVNIIAAFFAVSVKLFSFGGFKIGPVAGIIIEAVIIEMVFSVCGFNRLAIFFASLLAVFEGIPHFFITNFLMYGKGIFELYIKAVSSVSAFFNISGSSYIYIFLLWVAGHFVIAVVSYIISLKIIGRIKNDIY